MPKWYPYTCRGAILEGKKRPSEKRVLFVAIAPQGYCFGTLFSVSVVKSRNQVDVQSEAQGVQTIIVFALENK